jgi:acyl-CoA synthetase (AMP-forming)/AMP-acid ligase II
VPAASAPHAAFWRDALATHAGARPHAPALRWVGNRPGVLSWQGLHAEVGRLAADLRFARGAGPVTLALPAGAPVVCLLGVLAALCAEVPASLAHPRWPGARLRAWDRRVQPTHRLAGTPARPRLTVRRRPASPPPPAPGTALLMATSGSSGHPRAVQQSAEGVVENAGQFVRALGLDHGARHLAAAPLCHVAGLHVLTLPTLAAGGEVVLAQGADPASILGLLPAVSHTVLVPTLWHRLLDAGLAPAHVAGLHAAISGGAPMGEALQDRLLDAGLPLVHGYGLTEMTAMATLRLPLPPGRPRPDAHDVGLPGDRTRLRLVPLPTPAGAPPSALHRIQLQGPHRMLGYLGDDEATGRALDDGWLDTGDLGRWSAGGTLLVVGRADRRIISGGENVCPETTEAALRGLPEIEACHVGGVADPVWGRRVEALVVLRPGHATLSPASLQALATGLAPWERPRCVHPVEALPMLPHGKPDLAAADALLHHLAAAPDARTLPRSAS